MGKNTVTVPLPKVILWPAMILSTIFCTIFGITNKLDPKQYKLMVASAFLCSSESLQKNLNWKPKVNLMESLKKALKGYRENGFLT